MENIELRRSGKWLHCVHLDPQDHELEFTTPGWEQFSDRKLRGVDGDVRHFSDDSLRKCLKTGKRTSAAAEGRDMNGQKCRVCLLSFTGVESTMPTGSQESCESFINRW